MHNQTQIIETIIQLALIILFINWVANNLV